jgi:thiol-disulfide isomerase/thioredoxin
LTNIFYEYILVDVYYKQFNLSIMENNNATKIILAIITVLVLGGIVGFATGALSQPNKSEMSKMSSQMTSDAMIKKDDTTKMTDKMSKDGSMSKTMSSVDSMMKDSKDKMMMNSKSSWTKEEMMAMEKDPNRKMDSKMDSTMKDDQMVKEDAMMKNTMMKEGDKMMSNTGYMSYSADAATKNSEGVNVIFFHAPWCPSCKSIDADITKNVSSIPARFNILKADFDTSTELKKKYGVTQQSTFVKIDKNGNKVATTGQYEIKTLADIVAFGNK